MTGRRISRLRAGWIAAAVALSVALAPDARADEPVPSEASTNPNVFPESAAQPRLILIGAGVTVGWYGAAIGLSYLWPDSDGAKPLRIPVAGPYMALAETGCSSRESNCGTFDIVLRTILTGLSAVGQTGGVLAMIEGVLLPTQAPRHRAETKRASLHLAPLPIHEAEVAALPGLRTRAGMLDPIPLGLTLLGDF